MPWAEARSAPGPAQRRDTTWLEGPPEFGEVARALEGAAVQVWAEARARASTVAVDFTLAGRSGGTLVRLGTPTRVQERADLRVRIDASHAHRFWLGELSEPSLVLAGRLGAQGTARAMAAFLRLVPDISRRYCRGIGRASESPRRLPVLRQFALSGGMERPFRDRQEDGPWIAALILIGLHPACRAVESRAVVEAYERGEIPAGALRACVIELAAVANPSRGGTLRGTTDSIPAVARY